MPEINNEAVKTCSTGEHAALCGVSVRTMNITKLLGSNKLPGKLHIVGCALLNARAIVISVVRRHGSHPKMNRHVVAL